MLAQILMYGAVALYCATGIGLAFWSQRPWPLWPITFATWSLYVSAGILGFLAVLDGDFFSSRRLIGTLAMAIVIGPVLVGAIWAKLESTQQGIDAYTDRSSRRGKQL